jgi:ubiquinone/menaquinone biosynthesis C-methylase UbiE
MPTAAEVTAYWDTTASTFDTEPDHGLSAPAVRGAWSQRLREWIPDPSADVLDVGCGTGSLSLVLAGHGHRVTGVDLSPNMVALAQRKLGVAGHPASIMLGDASQPPVGGLRFDVVLARHLLWTLSDPQAALRQWIGLLRPGGHLVLVEGCWGTADDDASSAAGTSAMPWWGGVTADVLAAALQSLVARVHIEHLTDPLLWGREIHDERYVLLAHI